MAKHIFKIYNIFGLPTSFSFTLLEIKMLQGQDNCGEGQIISKGLFGVLEFSQKRNEWIHRSSKNEFVRSFFGRIWGYQKVLSRLSDL